MALNWLEDIVSHLYSLKGYLVIEDEDLTMPTEEYRKIRAHSDIDIIAIKENEIIHIECKSWWGDFKKEDEPKQFRRLEDRFKQARDLFLHGKKYSFLNQQELKIRNIFVTTDNNKNKSETGPWCRLKKFCDQKEVELVDIKLIVNELIKELKEHYPTRVKVGKENGIARALIYLMHNDFLKEPEDQ